jgi:SSS family solute:Na+ symporter
MSHYLQSATMPDFFGQRFGSRALSVAASAIVFVFLIPYTASLYNGLSRLFGMAFGIDYLWCVVGMAVLTGIYVLLGGYMATAVNDFIQGMVMLFGITAVILSVLHGNGGFTAALESLSQIPAESAPALQGAFTSFFGPQPIYLLGVVLLTSLGTWGLPQMVGKFYAIKDEDSIKKGTVISSIFAVVVAGGCYFLGGFGRLFDIDVGTQGYDAVIPEMLSKLSPVICGIALILVLSASMSTLSSLVLTSSSTLTLDFIAPVLMKDRDNEKKKLLIIRIFIAVFIAVSAVIAVVQYKLNVTFIAQLMGLSWGALAGSFLAPFLYGLYWKRTTKQACAVCFVWGSALMLANMFFKPYFPSFLQSPINCGALAMLGGMVIVPLVSVITRRPDKELTDSVFACYDKKVLAPVKDVLGEED